METDETQSQYQGLKGAFERGVVACRNISLREKLLTKLMGPKQKVVVLIPGNSVDTVSITEIQEGGLAYEQN
jgi:hypothetical protein